jgi:hypothetical protein
VAHELAHTLQQRGAGAPARDAAPVHGLEAEADSAADAVAAGRAAAVRPHPQAPGLQRKPKKYNKDIDEGHWDVSSDTKAYKALYVQWRSELTDVINSRCGKVDTLHDYRFVLMLAQRMVEQDGPHAKTDHNNPYNVMGDGDDNPPQFLRPDNKEGPEGAKEDKPAWFAAFTAEPVANAAYLDMVKTKFPGAFKAIATGGSTKDFVEGLYPGKPYNYATAAKDDYINGVRKRARLVVGDLRHVYSLYLKEYQAKLAANPPAATAPAVMGEPELNRLYVALLQQELAELDDLTDRIASDQPVNRPPVAAAGANP